MTRILNGTHESAIKSCP